jgi:serine/threonine-protein kinase RsbW
MVGEREVPMPGEADPDQPEEPMGDHATRFTYPASPEAVPAARTAAVEAASAHGIVGSTLEQVRLAVSEAVTNVVRHAYRDVPGEIRMTIARLPEELAVLVEDDGCGPRVPSANPGLGWGWKLIADAADGFTVSPRAAGGTQVSLRFRRSQAGGGARSAPDRGDRRERGCRATGSRRA